MKKYFFYFFCIFIFVILFFSLYSDRYYLDSCNPYVNAGYKAGLCVSAFLYVLYSSIIDLICFIRSKNVK